MNQEAASAITYRAEDLRGTESLAARLAGLVRQGDVILLVGDLGAGKTAFVKAFGLAMGVTEAITSPTFTLVQTYTSASSGMPIYHADLYRLGGGKDVADLGLDEQAEDGVTLVEWGDLGQSVLFPDYLKITIEVDGTQVRAMGDEAGSTGLGEARLFTLESVGSSWCGRLEQIK